MVEQLKDAVASGVEKTTSKMAETNPFLATTLAAVLLFAVWSAYVNHQYQKELLEIKLTDQEIASQRVGQVDAFTELLQELRTDGAADREFFAKRIEAAENDDRARYEAGKDIIAELAAHMIKLDEKMDMVINNQQIRSVVGRQQAPSQ